jgi:hypothetical protein
LLARFRDYDKWDGARPSARDNGRHKRAALAIGDDSVEINFRVLVMGSDMDELRFWPLVGEGLFVIFFKNIDLSSYNDDSTYCCAWTADFIIELWSGLTELQEYEGTPVNAALPWAQGSREILNLWVCPNCHRDTHNPIKGDKPGRLIVVHTGQYTVEGMLCFNCDIHQKRRNRPRPRAQEEEII